MRTPPVPNRRTPAFSFALVLVAALAVSVFAVPAAEADTLLKMKSHTDAFQVMGQTQPASDEEITLWIGDDRVLRSSADHAALLRLDQQKLYVIDRAAKTYSVLDLPVDFTAHIPPEMKQQMGQMLQAMEMSATVEPTDERKEVNGWSSRLYRVNLSNQMGMTIDSTVWVTNDVDVDLATFKEMMRAMASLQPGAGAAAEELLKIDGVPVLMESAISGMGGSTTSREELVSAETQAAPAGTYEIPEGYTEEEWNPMAQAQGGR